MKVLLLVLMSLGLGQTSTHPFLQVFPESSQFFEYQDVFLSCEMTDSANWTVWRISESRSELSPCGLGRGLLSSASTCQLNYLKPSDSGVYWCESEFRDSSQGVRIQVSEGSVVLESPVRPVTVGQDVTLRCRSKDDQKKYADAHFYKNGTLMEVEPSDHLTIRHVSMSDEDVYTCRISGLESPPSWLAVWGDSDPKSLTVSPDSSQIFEYESLTLSCGTNSEAQGWTVHRHINFQSPKTGPCGRDWGVRTSSFCNLQTVKPQDSGVYWCESRSKKRSNSVNISVFDSAAAVILRSPVLPVMEGDNVTLICQRNASVLPSSFFKDGSPIGSKSENQLILHQVTVADGGLYSCSIGGWESLPSRLLVRGSSRATPSSGWNYLTVARYLVVCSPYAVATLLVMSLSRHRPAAGGKPQVAMAMSPPNEEDEGLDQAYDDVTTEHHF
ncbi:unnamed protein product [Ophioblennius macclurei]